MEETYLQQKGDILVQWSKDDMGIQWIVSVSDGRYWTTITTESTFKRVKNVWLEGMKRVFVSGNTVYYREVK